MWYAESRPWPWTAESEGAVLAILVIEKCQRGGDKAGNPKDTGKLLWTFWASGISVSADECALAADHHMGSAHDAVRQGVTAAVDLIKASRHSETGKTL